MRTLYLHHCEAVKEHLLTKSFSSIPDAALSFRWRDRSRDSRHDRSVSVNRPNPEHRPRPNRVAPAAIKRTRESSYARKNASNVLYAVLLFLPLRLLYRSSFLSLSLSFSGYLSRFPALRFSLSPSP